MQDTIIRAMLAHSFADHIAAWLSKEEVETVEQINAENGNEGGCASHEYCDANMAMVDAFQEVFGREATMSEETPEEVALHEADYGHMNAAWEIAMKHGLYGLKAKKWED